MAEVTSDQIEQCTQPCVASVSEMGSAESVNQPDELFRRVLLTSFPRGISFSPAAESLLARAAGKALSDETRHALKATMFQREDGTWLLPEMVADDELLLRMISRANSYIDTAGYFSVDVLRDEFSPILRNLSHIYADFMHFFIRVIAPRLGCEIGFCGGKTDRICHRGL